MFCSSATRVSAAQASSYYCLLSFRDREAFLAHQVSDHHEGHDFAALIKSLKMEWVDPVDGAAPLAVTQPEALPANVDTAIAAAAELYPVEVQPWWLGYRVGA